MGSGQSVKVKTKLECPDGYDKEKFKKILLFYDKIDEDGDHVIQTEELSEIANLHIKNKIKMCENQKDDENDKYNNNMSKLELEEKQELEMVKKKYQKNKVDIKSQLDARLSNLESKKLNYENMDDKQKYKTLHNVISNEKNEIEFWDFFEYIKTRTNDIKNIEW